MAENWKDLKQPNLKSKTESIIYLILRDGDTTEQEKPLKITKKNIGKKRKGKRNRFTRNLLNKNIISNGRAFLPVFCFLGKS
jgi:hypothetical protein